MPPRRIQTRIEDLSPVERSLQEIGLGDFPLGGRIAAALSSAPPEGWRRTDLGRGYYLDLMEAVVRTACEWVDPSGVVLDPFLHREWSHTSPRYASSGAILLHFGRMPDIRELVYRTMDYSCAELASGNARKKGADFWMRELATAYMCLETVAGEEDLRRWRQLLGAVRPEETYSQVSPDGTDLDKFHNSVVYSSAGEYLREAAGLAPETNPNRLLWGRAFFDKYVGAQFGHFTELGMYRDPGDPITYDITTRLQLATALAFGYDGKLRETLDELLRRGALTMLLFLSPEGYVPYGGRSSQFHFQEAIVSALCELEARRYRTANPRLAGAFKRQAHLSALSVKRWLLDMRPFRHIKNGFEPSTQHGIDSYGHYSIYGLLAASFFGLAAIFADDSIEEEPAPAETGRYVVELAPAFHKVFATSRGSYLEIDTRADFKYDSTGLGRFLVNGAPVELGPAMPFTSTPAYIIDEELKPEQMVAIGPSWLSEKSGTWLALADLSDGLEHRLHSVREGPDSVVFVIEYSHPETGAEIVQEYELTMNSVRVRSRARVANKPVERIRFIVPLLVSDGRSRSEIQLHEPGVARLRYEGCTCEVRFDERLASAVLAEGLYANRNGIYRSLVLEQAGDEIEAKLSHKTNREAQMPVSS